MLAQISTQLVQLHSRYYGKGPTKAKTHMVNDTVVCILRGGFTTVERTLLETGQSESVYQMRRSFQTAMEDPFRAIVEEATGRKVIAYMSQVHFDPDLAVEFFALEPLEEHEETAAPQSSDGLPTAAPPSSDGDGLPTAAPPSSDGDGGPPEAEA